MGRKVVISAENLAIGYRSGKHRQKIVHGNLNFSLYSGEVTALLGLNGAGKSTLLRTLSRVLPPLSGSLMLNGRRMTEYSDSDFSRLMGVVLTDKVFAGGLTVYELVALGRYPYTGFFGKLEADDVLAVGNALQSVGMTDKRDCFIAQLSDGERQKAMIAKALAQECPVVLLDEPTAFLDVVSRIEIMHLLHKLAAEQNKTILLSTHDLEQALLLADRLWLMKKNCGLYAGNTEDVIFSGQIEQAFDRKQIHFDLASGSFHPQSCFSAEIFLEGDSVLHFWAKNALERNGYGVTGNAQNAICSLRLISSSRIEYCDSKGESVFSSFESLIDHLKG